MFLKLDSLVYMSMWDKQIVHAVNLSDRQLHTYQLDIGEFFSGKLFNSSLGFRMNGKVYTVEMRLP